MDKPTALSLAISRAFASRTPPESVPTYRCFRDSADEYDICRLRFLGRRWQDIPLEEARDWFDCLVYFDATELPCYLPAFMNAALRYPDENITHWTMSTLLSNHPDLMELLTQDEIVAVRQTVNFFAERPQDQDDETIQECALKWNA
jgi:hypothetical protein